MEQAEILQRWDTAQELYQAAIDAFRQERYRACVSLAYYACFQAMWVALGDPPLGRWRHLGIIRSFCQGQWAKTRMTPRSLAAVHKRLLALYTLRLDAHYRAQSIPSGQAQHGLDTVTDVMRLLRQHQRSQLQRNDDEY